MLRSKASMLSPLPRRRSGQGLRGSKKDGLDQDKRSRSVGRKSATASKRGMRTSQKDILPKKRSSSAGRRPANSSNTTKTTDLSAILSPLGASEKGGLQTGKTSSIGRPPTSFSSSNISSLLSPRQISEGGMRTIQRNGLEKKRSSSVGRRPGSASSDVSGSLSPTSDGSERAIRKSSKDGRGKKRSSSIGRQSTATQPRKAALISTLPRRRSDEILRSNKRDGTETKRSNAVERVSSSKAPAISSPTPISRPSEQDRDSFARKRSSSLQNKQANLFSLRPTHSHSPSPQPPPFSIRHLGLSPSMMRSKQETPLKEELSQTVSTLLSPGHSRGLPIRHITKSTSLQMLRKSAQPNTSRKQVSQRSSSFSGRSTVKVPASPSMKPRNQAAHSSTSDPKQVRRRVSKQKGSSKIDKIKGDSSSSEGRSSLVLSSSKPLDDRPRKVSFYDRIRYKSISHSRIVPEAIWYSKLEIMMLRRKEQDVKRQSRGCHNSTLLNVEGLLTEKEQRLTVQRRKESKEAIFDIQDANRKQREHQSGLASFREGKYVQGLNDDYDQHEAMAVEYERLTASAAQSARRRGTLLAMHVNLLSDLSLAYADDPSFPLFGNEEITAMKEESPKSAQGHPPLDILSPVIRKASVKSWLGSRGTPLKPSSHGGSSSISTKKFKMAM